MATGTVQFQSATPATPAAGLAVMADAVNHSTLGAGTAQFVKLMDGALGGTAGAPVTAANGLLVDVARVQGTAVTKEARTTTSAITSVSAAITDTPLLGINTGRFGAAVYAEGPGTLFLKLGNSASTTSYTVQMTPQTYYEVPFYWTGSVNGIWGTASGTARITEIT